MPRIARKDILKKFQAMIRRKQPIIGGGAGTGLSAKCEEAGGIDLIVIYNSGRYRMAGRGSLAGLMASRLRRSSMLRVHQSPGMRPKGKGCESMDLSRWSEANVEFMFEEIKKKLRMATGGSIKGSHFDPELYEDLKDLYDMVVSKSSFSISEIDAITSELGKLRKG